MISDASYIVNNEADYGWVLFNMKKATEKPLKIHINGELYRLMVVSVALFTTFLQRRLFHLLWRTLQPWLFNPVIFNVVIISCLKSKTRFGALGLEHFDSYPFPPPTHTQTERHEFSRERVSKHCNKYVAVCVCVFVGGGGLSLLRNHMAPRSFPPRGNLGSGLVL